ncbi:MAG: hypothetical protein JO086_15190 [Acidimicrobiia bacterium]|nr:hypothetical protein [Acidimicrobiia bacterium]
MALNDNDRDDDITPPARPRFAVADEANRDVVYALADMSLSAEALRVEIGGRRAPLAADGRKAVADRLTTAAREVAERITHPEGTT